MLRRSTARSVSHPGARAAILVSDLDDPMTAARKRCHAVLARASTAALEAAWQRYASRVRHGVLRQPEVGLVMLRGRVDGHGDPFHLGEASVCRCVVALHWAGDVESAASDTETSEPTIGVGYTLGRDRGKAELIACLEALARLSPVAREVEVEVLAPLAEAQRAERARRDADTGSSRVAFVTMVRGES
jgi:alpha-D-ribose 1-methylphosphonate 5-triphosphate synthase subunit PhnG